MIALTENLFRLARNLLTNERGRSPDIRMIGIGRSLVYGSIYEDGRYLSFTMDAENRHLNIAADYSESEWRYGASAAAYRAADIEDGDHENPHK